MSVSIDTSCSICIDTLENPVEGECCGVVVCRKCITKWAEDITRGCPHCRKPLGKMIKKTGLPKEWHESKFLQRQITWALPKPIELSEHNKLCILAIELFQEAGLKHISFTQEEWSSIQHLPCFKDYKFNICNQNPREDDETPCAFCNFHGYLKRVTINPKEKKIYGMILVCSGCGNKKVLNLWWQLILTRKSLYHISIDNGKKIIKCRDEIIEISKGYDTDWDKVIEIIDRNFEIGDGLYDHYTMEDLVNIIGVSIGILKSYFGTNLHSYLIKHLKFPPEQPNDNSYPTKFFYDPTWKKVQKLDEQFEDVPLFRLYSMTSLWKILRNNSLSEDYDKISKFKKEWDEETEMCFRLSDEPEHND